MGRGSDGKENLLENVMHRLQLMPPAEKMGLILTNGVLGSRLNSCRSGGENVFFIQRIPVLHIKTKAAAAVT